MSTLRRTVVYDTSTGKTYAGNFDPGNGHSAHMNLCKKAGLDPSKCVGGSLKGNKYGLELDYNSESLNRPFYGNCSMRLSESMYADGALKDGGFYSISQNGSINKSKKGYHNFRSIFD